MNTPMVYAQCGIRLRSEVPLDLPEVGGDGWDVDVVWGPDADDTRADPPGELAAERLTPDGSGWWYRATELDGGYLLRFQGSGDVLVSPDLWRIEVRADRAGRPELLPVLLAGTVSAFVLTLRGETVLHASSVAIDGVALAFSGPSGWGKTTLATLLCLNGASMIADDVLVVHPGLPPSCRGGATELRLRQGASALAAECASAVSRPTSDDRLALTLGTPVWDVVPLSALVFPAPSRSVTALDVRSVEPRHALVRLLGLARVEGWRRPDVVERDFARLSQLVNQVPMYAAIVPWGPPFAGSLASELAALVTDPPG